MQAREWQVHKFGGTSLADASCYQRVAEILLEQGTKRVGVVVSSMAGVTDALLSLVHKARHRAAEYRSELDAILNRHRMLIESLMPEQEHEPLLEMLTLGRMELEQVLQTVWLLRSDSRVTLDWVVGYGEVWSARILSAYLQTRRESVSWLDARKVLVVDEGEIGPAVAWDKSRRLWEQWLEQHQPDWFVMTGFLASNSEGIPTTLGRNGSDFSASILGALLGASLISIWTDVDGVLSADPRRVEDSVLLKEISYAEAMELAYFGAKILHPHTMTPAIQNGIPLRIRNTFRSDLMGTLICAEPSKVAAESLVQRSVKGFSTVDGMALVNLEGASMIGVPGVANRLFGALRGVGVSVVMISQASSEHSICFAVPEVQGALAKETVEKEFFHELHYGKIHTVEVVAGCSILAAVGDQMVERPGVAALFFGALARAGINVRAIAQGSSERNISAVIAEEDSVRALQAVHAGFYLSAQTISMGLIGPGAVGKTLLNQLDEQAEFLREQFQIDFRVRGVANSRTMCLDRCLNLATWESEWQDEAVDTDLSAFADHIQAEHLPHAVIVDCSASELVASHYEDWLRRGIHIVTPNKKANSGAFSYFETLRNVSRDRHTHYLFEATVGAGLPVIQTLQDLIQTGDQVHRIEGIFSGTLSYIFNTFGGAMAFSDVVQDARAKGFTEPDPRDDLSGMDVARKVVILARMMGLSLELEGLQVQNLVPEVLREEKDVEVFLERLAEHDAAMKAQQDEAEAAGEVLRYVGVVERRGDCVVELRRYPKTHPFARIQGTDNMIAFHTSRYGKQPLVVQGPGAGLEVTAGGVFGDLLRLASYLGAPT